MCTCQADLADPKTMATPHFYYPELQGTEQQVMLTGAEAAHARNSRRLRAGQNLSLLNGLGLVADCQIIEIERDAVSLQVLSFVQFKKPDHSLTIVTAIAKGDRQRTMIDMLAQLGVSQIITLECEFSVTKYNAKQTEKWQRVAVEACKQSQNPWLPVFGPHYSVPEVLQWLGKHTAHTALYADARGLNGSELAFSGDHLVILIGPEGGFSSREVSLFEADDLTPIKLGPAILRTETAAICAAAQFNHKISYTDK